MRASTRALIAAIDPFDEAERATQEWALAWIDSGAPLWRTAKPATPPVHLVSYFVLVDGDQVLLVEHRNAGLWLPTGGHVDPEEHPRTAAERECLEELGISASFLSPDPCFITRTSTVGATAGHTDVSLWFLLRGDSNAALAYDPVEFKSIRWFRRNEVPLKGTDPHLHRFLAKTAG